MAENTTTEDAVPFRRFPPFPSAPAGAKIVSFKDFKPSGIRIQLDPSDTASEIDGLGIPTVPLRVKHDTDEKKSGGKKKKKRKGVDVSDEPLKKMAWWDLWEEAEDTRMMQAKVDKNSPLTDRFIFAAEDFRSGRTWPPQSTGISHLWDAFRLYTGLLSGQPALRKMKNMPTVEADDFSDDEAEFEAAISKQGQDEKNVGKSGTPIQTDALYPDEDEKESDDALNLKMRAFLDDPELSMRIFFSSYMREKGLIWSVPNLRNLPRLVLFFLNFIIRNKALPERSENLRRAIALVTLAATELPLTARLGQTLPDTVSRACKELWGPKNASMFFGMFGNADQDVSGKNENMEVDGEASDLRKKRRADSEDIDEGPQDRGWGEVKSGSVEEIDPNADRVAGWGQEGGTSEDNHDGGDNSWGGDWGNGAANEWSQSSWNTDNITSSTSQGAAATEPLPDGWKTTHYSLTSLLGPTMLPLTHDTGVVEWSLRRVKTLILPNEAAQNDSTKSDVESGAKAVEDDLHSHFGRLILEPWLDWDKGNESDISTPKFLGSSRPRNPDKSEHDPCKDEISLLVEPTIIKDGIVMVGMGLGATWIQLRRQDVQNTVSSSQSDAIKFWYMEELMVILPSYYMQPEPKHDIES